MSKSNTSLALTRKDLDREDRRIRDLRKQGKSESFIKGWLRGWRSVGGVL